jgi:hypothetical protein
MCVTDVCDYVPDGYPPAPPINPPPSSFSSSACPGLRIHLRVPGLFSGVGAQACVLLVRVDRGRERDSLGVGGGERERER